MPVTMLTCPGCKIVLKPTKPVPEGKKVKCPKCSAIFVSGNAAPQPGNGIQAKTPTAPAPAKEESAGDEGWELVEDEAPAEVKREVPKVVEAVKLSDSHDDGKPPKLTYTNEPESESKKARKPRQRDDDEEDEEEAPKRVVRK